MKKGIVISTISILVLALAVLSVLVLIGPSITAKRCLTNFYSASDDEIYLLLSENEVDKVSDELHAKYDGLMLSETMDNLMNSRELLEAETLYHDEGISVSVVNIDLTKSKAATFDTAYYDFTAKLQFHDNASGENTNMDTEGQLMLKRTGLRWLVSNLHSEKGWSLLE